MKTFGCSMICSAVASLTGPATGSGCYGEPFQHGWGTPLVQSLTFSLSALSDRCSSGASFLSTAAPSSLVCCERSIMLTETTISVSFRTNGVPVSSVIAPRTAGTTICLVWLTEASALYWVVASTCRYQRRPPSTTTAASVSAYRPNSRRRDLGIIGGLHSAADHGRRTSPRRTATDAGSATGLCCGNGGPSGSTGRLSTSSRGAAWTCAASPCPGWRAWRWSGGGRRSAATRPWAGGGPRPPPAG